MSAPRRAKADAFQEAAQWVLRLEEGDLGDPLALDAWLDRSAANRRAFDQTLATSQAYAAAADALAARRSGSPRRRAALPLWGGPALAAGIAAAASLAWFMPPTAETFVTGPGQTRVVVLADGSRIELAGRSRLSLSRGRREREAALAEGEAFFVVTHQAAHPFRVLAGDRQITDLGTAFDVKRRGGVLAVAVVQGAVSVTRGEAPTGALQVAAGQRLVQRDGAATASLGPATAAEAAGWRAHRLVYRDAPLAEVVADLNAAFPAPVTLGDPRLGATPVSGVLRLDRQPEVLHLLALIAPVRAVRSGAGYRLDRSGPAPDQDEGRHRQPTE